MARRLTRGGPTEAEVEAIDRAEADPVVEPYNADTPAVGDVLQYETGMPDRPIPVEIQGSVRVDELPSRTGGIFSRTITTTTPYRLNENPRRKAVTIIAATADIRIGRTQADALNDGAGVQWPAAVPLVLQSADELWILAVGGSTAVGFIVEDWSR